MRIIKKILIGLGAFFVIIIGLVAFLAGSASEFKEKHQKFVVSYTKEFSKNWEINSVSSQTTNDMLSQINTPNGKHAMGVFSSLGELLEASDIEIQNYSANAGGPTVGVFKFKAKFKNANTLVTITIHETDGIAKAHTFNVDPISNISTPNEFKT